MATNYKQVDMANYNRRVDWRSIWELDKRSMLDTMIDNLAADLKAGYSPIGSNVMQQIVALNDYKLEYEQRAASLDKYDREYSNRWCYKDLVVRGVIA